MDPAISVRDGLATYSFGSGPPTFLMPGPHRFQRPGLRSADALIAGLVALGRRVITFDPPGSGRSMRPAHLSMGEMLACSDEALDEASAEGPVDALGHSMGGLAMLAYALERPDALRRLLLVGTGSGSAALRARGAIHRPGHPDFWRMALIGSLQAAWPFRGPERMVLNLIERASFFDRRWFQPRPVSWSDWLRPREGRTDWHRVARRLDYRSRLAEIRIPTLILVGRHDPQFPPACSAELHAGMAGSQLVHFARSGHYPFIEEADAFWSAVNAFLGDGDEPAGSTGRRTGTVAHFEPAARHSWPSPAARRVGRDRIRRDERCIAGGCGWP